MAVSSPRPPGQSIVTPPSLRANLRLYLLLAALGACPPLLAACHGAPHGDPAWESSRYVIDVDWDERVALRCLIHGYSLYRGCDGGVPREAFLKLVLVRDGGMRVIHSLGDLHGYVRIKNAEEALEFVRLRTNVDTGYLFKSEAYYEITEAKQASPGFCEIDAADFVRLRVQTPQVTHCADGFKIVRFVVDEDKNLFRARETVQRNGLHHIDFDRAAEHPIDVSLPRYY